MVAAFPHIFNRLVASFRRPPDRSPVVADVACPLTQPEAVLPPWVAADPVVQKYRALLGDLPWNQFLTRYRWRIRYQVCPSSPQPPSPMRGEGGPPDMRRPDAVKNPSPALGEGFGERAVADEFDSPGEGTHCGRIDRQAGAAGQTLINGQSAHVGAALLAQKRSQSAPATAPRTAEPLCSPTATGVSAVAVKLRW